MQRQAHQLTFGVGLIVVLGVTASGCRLADRSVEKASQTPSSITTNAPVTSETPDSSSQNAETASSTAEESETTAANCVQQARKQLKLTADQKAQLQEMTEQDTAKIEAVLDDQQKETWKQAIASGQNQRKALKSTTLSDQQKQQVRAIFKDQRQQLTAVLTPEQQQVLKRRRECQ
jgi:Spy/CpxP family protein refolding chaperone